MLFTRLHYYAKSLGMKMGITCTKVCGICSEVKQVINTIFMANIMVLDKLVLKIFNKVAS